MANTIKYDDLRLEVANNGFILSFTEIKKKPESRSEDRYENEIRDYKKEVFQWTQGVMALERMTELAGKMNPKAGEALVKEAIG